MDGTIEQAVAVTGLLAYLHFSGFMEVQILLTLLVVVLCALPAPARWLKGIAAAGQWMGRQRLLGIILVFIVSFVGTASLALRRGLPQPYVHDEFSYLLSADTFAHGRLTNPTPPAWQHFESMHILVQPSYSSKYPPGQGLIMALGQVTMGHPIWGVWLSCALAAALTCWMLWAFVSPPWALLGGLMLAIHPQMLEWGQRYWGGALAVVGGALLVGGFGRLMRRPLSCYRMRARDGAAMALGMLVVANTRPFEGLIVTALLLAALAWRLWCDTRPGGSLAVTGGRSVAPQWLFRKLVLPMALVLAPGAVWMGYYNYRVTGHVLKLPYQEHQRQYAAVPLFIFQHKPAQPAYNNRELENFCVREQGYWYLRHGNWGKLWEEAAKNIGRLYDGCLGNAAVLAAPLLVLPWALRKQLRLRLLCLALLLFSLVLLTETFMYPHYAAPVAGVVVTIDILAMRWMYRLDQRLGRLVVRCTVVVFTLWSLFWCIGFFNWRQADWEHWNGKDGWTAWRQGIVDNILAAKPGKHLVLVRYGDHNVHQEWVYNGADLAGSKVIFARDLGPERNRQLLAGFPDRQPWLIEPEGNRREPVKYVAGE